MTRSTVPNRPDVSAALLAYLRDEASASSDFVDEILDTSGIVGRYGGIDGRHTLIEIMRSLIVLTGSDDAAVAWLFNSRGFTAIAGDDACVALENGEFWTLTVMQDWLRILEAHRLDCPALIESVFRGSASTEATTIGPALSKHRSRKLGSGKRVKDG